MLPQRLAGLGASLLRPTERVCASVWRTGPSRSPCAWSVRGSPNLTGGRRTGREATQARAAPTRVPRAHSRDAESPELRLPRTAAHTQVGLSSRVLALPRWLSGAPGGEGGAGGVGASDLSSLLEEPGPLWPGLQSSQVTAGTATRRAATGSPSVGQPLPGLRLHQTSSQGAPSPQRGPGARCPAGS